MSIPNSNNRYQNSDASSIYNIKQNWNQYLKDFADIDFTNVIDNNKFNSIQVSGTGAINYWTNNGVFLPTYQTDHINTTFVSGGYVSQGITTKLRANTNYTMIMYGSAATSGAIKVSVYSPVANQIYNLDNPLEVTGASFTLNSVSGGVSQKHITTFKTNASTITGPIYVKIENITTGNVNFNLYDILVYSSLLELGNLPPFKELPIQPNIIPGAVYIDTVYDPTGIAVAGTPLINTGYLQDFYTNRKYNFVALNNEFFLHELNYDETREPANPLGIKITNDEDNKTFYLRVVNKELELEEISYLPLIGVPNPTITDFENGCVYSLHVSGGELNLVQNAFYASDTVYEDVVDGKKYIIIVEGAALKIVETDSSCLVNVETSATFKTMKDLYNGKVYSLVVSGGALYNAETSGSGDHKAFYHVRDYRDNLDYNIVIENGILSIVESYNLSLDEMFLRLNDQDTKFSELYNTDSTLATSISDLTSVVDGNTSSINTLSVSAIANKNDITTLSASATYNRNAVDSLSNLPAGVILSWPSSASLPPRFIKANGATNLSTTAYSDLFAVYQYQFGGIPASGLFGVPDYRGVALRGLDEGRGLDAGRTLNSYQADALQNHTHDFSWTYTLGASDAPGNLPADASDAGAYSLGYTGTTTGVGGAYSYASETRMKNTATIFIIKY